MFQSKIEFRSLQCKPELPDSWILHLKGHDCSIVLAAGSPWKERTISSLEMKSSSVLRTADRFKMVLIWNWPSAADSSPILPPSGWFGKMWLGILVKFDYFILLESHSLSGRPRHRHDAPNENAWWAPPTKSLIFASYLRGSLRHAADTPPLEGLLILRCAIWDPVEGLQIWKIKVAKMGVQDLNFSFVQRVADALLWSSRGGGGWGGCDNVLDEY